MSFLKRNTTKKPSLGNERNNEVKEDDKNNQEKDKKENQNVVKKKTRINQAYMVLTRPLVTEKVNDLVKFRKYAFEVSVNANKPEIIKAISNVYGVKPISINILNLKGKLVKKGKKIGKRKDRKKAIITLKKGETITIHEKV